MASAGCSLMEAYNVPSFDPPRRRKGCVVEPQSIKTSSEPYEPYQDTARSEMAAFAPPRPRAPQTEGFESRGDTLPKYYSGYTQDKKYYCDTYNICPKTTEGFESGVAGVAVNAAPSRNTGVAAPNVAKASCNGPLMAPNYEYPMTPEARRQYDKAIALSINQPQGSTPYEPPPPLPAAAQPNDISGYTDEDLDQFLKTNEMKATPFQLPRVPKDDHPVPGRDPHATPFAESMNNFMDSNGTPQLRPKETDANTVAPAAPAPKDPWEKVWDIALFVIAGLLLILLLDQLFKLAMLYGMKRAFLAIEPLLEKAMASDLK